MEIIEKLEDYAHLKGSLALTIGTFDGMHRGHQAVLQNVLRLASPDGHTCAITFSNHPSTVLMPNEPICLLTTLEHKIALFEKTEINTLLLLPFTKYLAKHSAASFIENVRQFIPFTHLVLGHDATLGRDRQGNRSVMMELGDQWGFSVHYLEEFRYEGRPISSTLIRTLLQEGNLDRVEELLARPYSIYSCATKLSPGFYSIDAKSLCLPPPGLYPVEILSENRLADLKISEEGNIHLIVKNNLELNDDFLEIKFKSNKHT